MSLVAYGSSDESDQSDTEDNNQNDKPSTSCSDNAVKQTEENLVQDDHFSDSDTELDSKAVGSLDNKLKGNG